MIDMCFVHVSFIESSCALLLHYRIIRYPVPASLFYLATYLLMFCFFSCLLCVCHILLLHCYFISRHFLLFLDWEDSNTFHVSFSFPTLMLLMSRAISMIMSLTSLLVDATLMMASHHRPLGMGVE